MSYNQAPPNIGEPYTPPGYPPPPPPQGYPGGYPPQAYPQPPPVGYPPPQYGQPPPPPQPKSNDGCLMGLLAGMCFCCALEECCCDCF